MKNLANHLKNISHDMINHYLRYQYLDSQEIGEMSKNKSSQIQQHI